MVLGLQNKNISVSINSSKFYSNYLAQKEKKINMWSKKFTCGCLKPLPIKR